VVEDTPAATALYAVYIPALNFPQIERRRREAEVKVDNSTEDKYNATYKP
jgi:hypothetical protein